MSQTTENYIRSLEMSLATIDELLGQFEQQAADQDGPHRSALLDQMRDLREERTRLLHALQDAAERDSEAAATARNRFDHSYTRALGYGDSPARYE